MLAQVLACSEYFPYVQKGQLKQKKRMPRVRAEPGAGLSRSWVRRATRFPRRRAPGGFRKDFERLPKKGTDSAMTPAVATSGSGVHAAVIAGARGAGRCSGVFGSTAPE